MMLDAVALLLAQAATTLPTTQAVELAHDAAREAAQPAWVGSAVALLAAITALIVALTGFMREGATRGTLGAVINVLNQFHGRSAAGEANVRALAQVVNDAPAVPARVQLADLPPLPPTLTGSTSTEGRTLAGLGLVAAPPPVVPEPRIITTANPAAAPAPLYRPAGTPPPGGQPSAPPAPPPTGR